MCMGEFVDERESGWLVSMGVEREGERLCGK